MDHLFRRLLITPLLLITNNTPSFLKTLNYPLPPTKGVKMSLPSLSSCPIQPKINRVLLEKIRVGPQGYGLDNWWPILNLIQPNLKMTRPIMGIIASAVKPNPHLYLQCNCPNRKYMIGSGNKFSQNLTKPICKHP